MTSTTRPADRYGDRPPVDRRRWAWFAAPVLALAVLAVAWAAWHRSSQVTWQEISFDASEPLRVTLTFQVSRPAGMAVSCTVVALNQGQAPVGLTDAEVAPGPDRVVQLRVDVATTEPAVAAKIRSCALRSP